MTVLLLLMRKRGKREGCAVGKAKRMRNNHKTDTISFKKKILQGVCRKTWIRKFRNCARVFEQNKLNPCTHDYHE